MRKKFLFVLLICFLLLFPFLVLGQNLTERNVHDQITTGESVNANARITQLITLPFWLSLLLTILCGIVLSLWSALLMELLKNKSQRFKFIFFVVMTIILIIALILLFNLSFEKTIIEIQL
ncbi:hypothetical protein COY26_02895 [Candidatus Woesearchaeota archaeon CG_4_10_14_0_2_um_filter_33_10]|nr:MAG: hypothetical protein AUJ83_00370 [Candidatus Woesearchaeota archaeon CG1_02_33_12]PIN78527.1 MAG: hypothetical protein COV14_03200 [Candidatus Woesearchaeota archaeon CG10_big_fil_rev_8_21_14_0_10_33_12]PIU73084.1 MAG: hypothetical protein COS79_00220 [Candidatus Woesearchaeota archaeon CG06_land_8_20_14_3_00_33_13]PIZ53048.1 MAG: hypothetical protein COY26_02895 [Candidatus Woesearchaeota archaeon CG_4_10_14_0_2_um_filter_33_10]